MTPAQITVAIVDDDPSVRKALKRLLKSVGMATQAYPSAEDFLHSAAVHACTCMVLDIHMPGMSGLELQVELARRETKIPIVFITAHHDDGLRNQALNGGATAFLPKPFDETELVEAIKAML